MTMPLIYDKPWRPSPYGEPHPWNPWPSHERRCPGCGAVLRTEWGTHCCPGPFPFGPYFAGNGPFEPLGGVRADGVFGFTYQFNSIGM